MSEAPYSTGSSASEEDERNLHGEKWSIFTTNTNSTTIHGLCVGNAQCD